MTEKKIPALDDRDGQIQALTVALMIGLSNGGERGYTLIFTEVRGIAEMLYSFGVRQTEHVEQIEIDPADLLPGWMKEQVREQSEPVPVQPDLTAPQDTPLVGEAPKPPKRIPKNLLAQVVSD